jgi:hypothetical protein
MAITRDIKIAKSSQEIDNLSFDTKFNVNAVEILAYNESADTLERIPQPATASNQTNGTQKTKLTDDYGWNAEFTPMDELRVVEPVRLVGSTFVGSTVDTNFWTVTIAASGGTIATADQTTEPGALTISSKTDATGSAIVQSNRQARYTGGSANRYRAQIRFGDTGKVDNTKRWGAFDGTDGCYFKLSGTTLSVNTMKAGAEVSVASASWNGSTTTPTLTNNNTYEIYMTNGSVKFIINGVAVHTVTASAATWTSTINLPARVDNINSGNTTNTIMSVRVHTIYRLGQLLTNTITKNITGVNSSQILKYSAGTLHAVIVNTPVNNATINIYDNTTGTGNKIGTLTLPNSATPFVINYGTNGAAFNNGLNIVPSSTTLDLTIIYE